MLIRASFDETKKFRTNLKSAVVKSGSGKQGASSQKIISVFIGFNIFRTFLYTEMKVFCILFNHTKMSLKVSEKPEIILSITRNTTIIFSSSQDNGSIQNLFTEKSAIERIKTFVTTKMLLKICPTQNK